VQAALDKLQRQVSAKHYQIFYARVIEEMPVMKVAKLLGAKVAEVYLVTHRLKPLFEKAVRGLQARERDGLRAEAENRMQTSQGTYTPRRRWVATRRVRRGSAPRDSQWIGGGSYGEVWLARNIMGVHRAIKIIRRSRFESG